MRHRSRRLLAACAGVALQLLGGCGGSSSSNAPGPSLTITKVGWAEENIDPSYWTTPPPNGETAFYDFWIHYVGEISFADIEYARVYTPSGGYWNLAKQADWLDSANHVLGGWHRMYWSTQVHALPLGTLQVEVKLTDGALAKYALNVPAPASTTVGPYLTMHTEDLALASPTSAPMVKRATLGPGPTLTAATQTIALTFSVVDPNVQNGWVWFYDAGGNYLGGFFHFVDAATGLATPRLAGSVLHNDGTPNTLTVSSSDLTLQSGATFGQIARFRVVLTDGAQYLPRASYDCRSISAAAALTVQ